MRGRRIGIAGGTTAFVATVAVLLFPAGAAADLAGPCTASINGVSVNGLALTASDAIDVKEHAIVPVSMGARVPITHYTIDLSFGGFQWTVKDQDTNNTSWTNTVNVDDYSKYGVGLYEVSGTSTGQGGLDCTGSALVKVSGDPLGTVAGDAGVALVALGVAGIGWATIRAARSTGGSRWRPSILGLVAGLLGGLGVGILLQQYAVTFPTRTVAIVELAVGLLLGLVVPWVGRWIGARGGAPAAAA